MLLSLIAFLFPSPSLVFLLFLTAIPAKHTHSTVTFRVGRDCLLQGTVYAAHGQKRKRACDSHVFTPDSIYLHRSPATPPFILTFILPVSPHLFPPLSWPVCPSPQPVFLCLSPFPFAVCDIDSKVAVLLTAATLLNIAGSVSVAACRGEWRRGSFAQSLQLQLPLTNRLVNRRVGHTHTRPPASTQRYIHAYMSLHRSTCTCARAIFAYVCDGALCQRVRGLVMTLLWVSP